MNPTIPSLILIGVSILKVLGLLERLGSAIPHPLERTPLDYHEMDLGPGLQTQLVQKFSEPMVQSFCALHWLLVCANFCLRIRLVSFQRPLSGDIVMIERGLVLISVERHPSYTFYKLPPSSTKTRLHVASMLPELEAVSEVVNEIMPALFKTTISSEVFAKKDLKHGWALFQVA
ncbi:unnamed protein product [Calypogeia fissa]